MFGPLPKNEEVVNVVSVTAAEVALPQLEVATKLYKAASVAVATAIFNVAVVALAIGTPFLSH
jgi:hypothetical protein